MLNVDTEIDPTIVDLESPLWYNDVWYDACIYKSLTF